MADDTTLSGARAEAGLAPVKGRDPLSNEARKLVAREATKAMVAQNLMLASILSRFWPSYLFKPAREQRNLPYMVCIQSPAGPLCWRIRHDHDNEDDSEMPLFDHIKDRREHGPKNYQAGDKVALLLLLSTEGWK